MSNGLKMAQILQGDYFTCDTKYKFTKHAIIRMRERGISIADVYSSSPAEKPILITGKRKRKKSQTIITTYREAPKLLINKLKGLGNFPKQLVSQSVPLPSSLIQVLIAEAPLFSKQHKCKVYVNRECNCVKISVREERYLQPIVEIIKKFAASGDVDELRLPKIPKQPSYNKAKEEEKEKRTCIRSANGPPVTNGKAVARKQRKHERKLIKAPQRGNKRFGMLLVNTILKRIEGNA